MKQQLKETMRYGKVEFDILWNFDFPLDLSKPENEATLKILKVGFENAKARQFASKASKAYAAAIGKKLADFSTEMVDDCEEAEKCWKAAVAGSDYEVSNFRDWVPSANSGIAPAKILMWLQSLPQDMQISAIINGMTVEDIRNEIIEAN